MTRAVRLFSYFVIGFLLSICAVFAHAETMPATVWTSGQKVVEATWVFKDGANANSASTPGESCSGYRAAGLYGFANCGAFVDSGSRTNGGNVGQCLRNMNSTTCGQSSYIYSYGTCATGYTMFWQGTNQKCSNNSTVYTCPDASWSLSGTTCTRSDCSSGYDHDASGACVKNCTGKMGQATVNAGYSFAGSSRSVGGCMVKCRVSTFSGYGSSGSECTFTGASAPANDPEAQALPSDPTKIPPESPQDCYSRGQGYIQTSSGITCVPSMDAPEGQKPTKIEEGKSSESGTPGTNGKPDPGSSDYKKTDITTSTEGGKTTTKTTETVNGTAGENGVSCPSGFTLNGDGATCSKTTSKTTDNSTFCQEYPKAAACLADEDAKDSVFGGTCESGFSCTGDAATCAIAKASYETRCMFLPDETTALHDVDNPGGTAADVTASISALNADGSKDFNIATEFQSKNQAYVNYSSGCPVGSQSYTIGRATFTLDGEIVCSIGNFVKLLIHILAYMALIRLFASKLV